MDALVDQCLFGIGYEPAGEGMGRASRAKEQEDNLASSGEPGLAGFVEDMLGPYESQGRGFQHSHRATTDARSFSRCSVIVSASPSRNTSRRFSSEMLGMA